MTHVDIIECTSPTELYRHYDGQFEAQDAYIELDLRDGQLLADYNGEIGGAVPFSVRHGFQRRWTIPVLTADAANHVMREIAPLANRILADWEEDWDGQNRVARLGDDAEAAEDEIIAHLGSDDAEHPFNEADLVGQWGIDGATNGLEADEYGITGATSDERLEEIGHQILKDLAECSNNPVTVCHGLDDYLRDLRRQAADAPDDEDELTVDGSDSEVAVWSLVRGQSPTAGAVKPGPTGVDVPDEILAWARRHGLNENASDVYLLVTPRDEAGEVRGEVAWREYRVTPDEMTSLRDALANLVH